MSVVCPECGIEHEDEVLTCDCGYAFPVRKPGLLKRAYRSVSRLLLPKCPHCGSREQTRIGLDLTYQCQVCKRVHWNRRAHRINSLFNSLYGPAWTFWLPWTLATTFGTTAILYLMALLGFAALSGAILGAIGGAILLGLLQEWCLRQEVGQLAGWAWITAAGWSVTLLTFYVLGPFFLHLELNSKIARTDSDILMLLILSVLQAGTGIGQWFILRRKVNRAAWWVPATVVSFAVASVIAAYAALVVTGGSILLPGITFGLADGALAGVVIVRLLQRQQKSSVS